MKALKFSFTLLLLLCFSFSLWAKRVSGNVISGEDGSPVVAAYLSVFLNDSISSMSQSDAAGEFSFEIPDRSVATIAVTALGFRDNEVIFDTDTVAGPIRIILEEAALSKDLSEVTVTADKSHIVKRTANGQIFYLSSSAKKEHNPFIALAEIPLLISDFSTSSVKLVNGKQPLVLIDGNQVNSGISPILPEDIESVEVITAVPARYLQEGYGGIVNIRLKKNRSPYVWFGASGTLGYPVVNSGPGVNFEVGNEKFSVYGSGIYSFTRNAKTVSEISQSNTGYRQDYTSTSLRDSDRWLGWILMKYRPTLKDYLAASIRFSDSKSNSTSSAVGDYFADESEDYHAEGRNDDKGRILNANLYYKHAFADYNNLEISAVINSNSNKLDALNEETIGMDTKEYLLQFRNRRTSGSVKADYSKIFDNGYSMAFGNHLTLNSDRIEQCLPANPLFRHRKVNEYIYASFGGMAGKLSYDLSAGLEAIWLKAGDTNNSYVRPRGTVSGTWSFTNSSSLQLSYTLSNETPDISMLNPYNTSTDPLVVSSGNPLLKPKTEHDITLKYTFNRNGWYVAPLFCYINTRDLFSPWGYTEGDVYHSTYRNSGHYSYTTYCLTVGYNAPWCSIYAYNGWTDQYYHGQHSKGAFETLVNLLIKVKKIYFIADLDYVTKSYTENSVTRNHNPINTRFHVSYNFTPDFYIAVGLQNFTGTVRSTTDMKQGSFRQITETFDRGIGRGFSPYIRIYYNFRKNQKRKIKFGNPQFIEETGISLKK